MADGHVIPLQLDKGLLKFSIRTPTAEEEKNCTTVDLTSDLPWDPHEVNDEAMDAMDILKLT